MKGTSLIERVTALGAAAVVTFVIVAVSVACGLSVSAQSIALASSSPSVPSTTTGPLPTARKPTVAGDGIWPNSDFHGRDRSSPFRGHTWLSGRAAQHNRLDLQALCIPAQDVVQSCYVSRAGSLGTGQVQGVAGA
jgi:hypothetical protein